MTAISFLRLRVTLLKLIIFSIIKDVSRVQNLFSDLGELRQKSIAEFPTSWKLRNILLNNPWPK
jgi:hypothetical protein